MIRPGTPGYLIRMKNGATPFVISDPIHWPVSIISRVMCVTKMDYPEVTQPQDDDVDLEEEFPCC